MIYIRLLNLASFDKIKLELYRFLQIQRLLYYSRGSETLAHRANSFVSPGHSLKKSKPHDMRNRRYTGKLKISLKDDTIIS